MRQEIADIRDRMKQHESRIKDRIETDFLKIREAFNARMIGKRGKLNFTARAHKKCKCPVCEAEFEA